MRSCRALSLLAVSCCALACTATPSSAPDAGGQGGPGAAPLPDAGSAPALLDGGLRPSPWRTGLTQGLDGPPGWHVPPEPSRVLYPVERTHSPVTRPLAEHLRQVVLHGKGTHSNVFMKVGDSLTVSPSFFSCFKGNLQGTGQPWELNVRLDGRSELAETVLHYRSALIGDSSPFDRSSRAAQVGVSVEWPLSGTPPPLQLELEALRPEVALVLFGTNDLAVGGAATTPLEAKLVPYHRGLAALVDALLAKGVVPVLSTLPPRTDDPAYLQIIPAFNAVVRAVAQARQVPLVDYHRALLPLRELGLGDDGVHPSVRDYNTGCFLDAEGLAYGYNVRNLVMLQGLDRVMRVVVDGREQLDAEAASLQGEGVPSAPFVIPGLPFSDARDTRLAAPGKLQGYSGCATARPGAGPERVYRLVLAAPTALRIIALNRVSDAAAGPAPSDVDVHLMAGAPEGARCLRSADTMLAGTLAAGEYYLSVDTVQGGAGAGSEYALAVVPCAAGDARCTPALNP